MVSVKRASQISPQHGNWRGRRGFSLIQSLALPQRSLNNTLDSSEASVFEQHSSTGIQDPLHSIHLLIQVVIKLHNLQRHFFADCIVIFPICMLGWSPFPLSSAVLDASAHLLNRDTFKSLRPEPRLILFFLMGVPSFIGEKGWTVPINVIEFATDEAKIAQFLVPKDNKRGDSIKDNFGASDEGFQNISKTRTLKHLTQDKALTETSTSSTLPILFPVNHQRTWSEVVFRVHGFGPKMVLHSSQDQKFVHCP